ncbi:MAG: anti-sigma factor antagonist [Myxococcales bacterium]|nr:anti-sigma factor antagonist [Myxococcales bacterium]
MNEGHRRSKTTTETFTLADGVVCLVIRGTLSHLHVPQIVEWLERVAREQAPRGLIIDCSEMDAIDPGVGGRLIAHARERGVRIEHTVVVTRASAVRALAGAAAVVLKDRVVECVSSRADALALLSARVGRAGRVRQHSGEQPKPGALALPQPAQTDPAKRSAG